MIGLWSRSTRFRFIERLRSSVIPKLDVEMSFADVLSSSALSVLSMTTYGVVAMAVTRLKLVSPDSGAVL